MINLLKLILLTSLIFGDDGEGPLLTNIISTSDFYYGNPIQIDIQAVDKDEISEIILYYRFSPDENYKNNEMEKEINYFTIIPGFEVISNKIEYYFLATDIFGNQREFPSDGSDNPLTLPILKPFDDEINNYEVNLIEPQNNSENQDVSIIMLSIYNQNKKITKNNIEIILNNNNITEDCNISNDLIIYVSPERLNNGPYKLIFKIYRQKEEPFVKEFNFKSSKEFQNIGIKKYNWIEEIKYSGNIDYTSDYDKFNYPNNIDQQSSSRPLDVQRYNFNFKAKYKQFAIQSSMLFNTHFIDENALLNKQYKQPVDRLKIGITTPYGIFNLGDYSTTFSDLTLKGARVRGLHSSVQIGILKITYVRGKTKELIQSYHYDDPDGTNNSTLPGFYLENGTFIYYDKGTPSRNLRALRTEFNFGKKINFGLTGLTSYDVQDVDIPYSELYSEYLFAGNALVGTDLTIFLNNKRTWIGFETAISMTNNILDENINNYEEFQLNKEQRDIVGALEDIIGFSITTDLLLGRDQGRGLSIPNPPVDENFNMEIDSDYLKKIFLDGTYKIKFKSPFILFNIPCNINGEYKRIPFSFVSFGNPSIAKDIQGLTTKLKMNFLNNKVIVSLGYDNDYDNVNDYKLTTTSSLGSSMGINLNFDKIPNINYSIKLQERKDNGGLINNTTITHTITPTYKFNLMSLKIGLNNNLVIMDYNDLLPIENNTENNNFQQISYSNSLSLSTKQLGINTGIGYSKNDPENIDKSETKFLAISSKISYKFKNNKLSCYIGANGIRGENTDIDNGINNTKDSFKIGAQYKLNQTSTIKYNIEYLIFNDKKDSNNNYTEIKGNLSFRISF